MNHGGCALCPRACGADRNAGERGFCGETSELRLAGACLHFGEEPPLTGTGGSGAVFVTGCGLGCSFCQNYQISQGGMGRVVSTGEFAAICLALQAAGAVNVNVVTGTQGIPALVQGLGAAKDAGLSIPVCWNSSAYESLDALKMIAPLVDIWLPDLKALSGELCGRIFSAPGYPQAAKEGILFMLDQAPLRFRRAPGGEAVLAQGVIVRHLFLPGQMENTLAVLDWLKKHVDSRALISLMTQYTPVPGSPAGMRRGAGAGAEPGDSAGSGNSVAGARGGAWPDGAAGGLEERFVSPGEAANLRELVDAYGFREVFFQELCPGDDWLPDFSKERMFPSHLAQTIWHWRHP